MEFKNEKIIIFTKEERIERNKLVNKLNPLL